MKKFIGKSAAALTAFVLAILMAFQLPVQVFADSKPEYISEIKISIAAGKKDSQKSAAQKELTDAGYTLLTHDSNYTEDGKTVAQKGDAVNMNYGTGEVEVYLGYKTTTDRDDAITDISMMEMAKKSDKNQPYSFSAYDEMLKEYKKQINASIASIEDAITEFAANYKKGSPAAKWAYTQLNRFKDTDLEKNNKIGDIILSMAADGFSDNEKEQLQNYFLKGNINFVNSMNIALGIGCAEYKTDNTWIERFAQSSADDEYEKSYDDTVAAILDGWESFYDALYSFKKTGLVDASESNVKNYIQGLQDSNEISDEKAVNIMFGAAATRYLEKYEYNGESMLDFFLQDRDPDNIDKEALIPLANALTKGQRATVESVGLRGLFSGLTNTANYWNDASEQLNNMLDDNGIEKDDTIGIYEGVNEAMYNSDGVALTSEAMTSSSSQEDDGMWSGLSKDSQRLVTLCGGIAFCMFAGTFLYAVSNINTVSMLAVSLDSYSEAISTVFTKGVITTFAVTIGLMLIFAGLAVGIVLYNYYNPDYTEIPAVMVDSVSKTSKQGIVNTYYTYYDAVKCDYNGETDIPADTNAWTGKRWNAMYITKDETAGDPILAKDFTAQYSSNEKEDCTGVARFHEENAYNMNAHQYKDNANGIYLFYKTDDGTASYEGTVLSTADLGLGIGGGAVGGIIIGMLAMNIKGKNRKKVSD